MPDRQFEILVVGRANVEIILGPEYHFEPTDGGVLVAKDGWNEKILTDKRPSKTVDKVTALTVQDEFMKRLRGTYVKDGGGGAFNSGRTQARIATTSSQLGVTVLTPMRPELFFADDHFDLIAALSELGIRQLCMNLQPLNYNIVGTLKDEDGENKIVIRNRPTGGKFLLTREHKGTVEQYINPASGVLINALNHLDMTKHIVQYVHDQNEKAYQELERLRQEGNIEDVVNGPDFFSRPRHKKVLTVITKPGIDQRALIENIYPYTGLIFNREDIRTLFYGTDEGEGYGRELAAMAQLRFGIPTEHGVKRRVLDTHNSIYVTLGAEGHLVAVGDTAYHLRMAAAIGKELNEKIEENKSSTTGAGDSFAAGVSYAETMGRGTDVKVTGATANTAVCKHLGLDRIVHPEQMEILKTFDLRDHYEIGGLPARRA